MKLAVIIGVIHMSFGILMKASNSMYFRNWLDFFFEFVPQLIFMLVTFGYMDFLIFYKWGTDWRGNSAKAPSIITTMINMPLKLGSTDGTPLYNSSLQDSLQLLFLLTALICVPLMLFPKPIILNMRYKRSHHRGSFEE